MSGTSRQLTFGVTVNDTEHWTDKQREEYEDDDGVITFLWEYVADIVQTFINANPELFRSETLV